MIRLYDRKAFYKVKIVFINHVKDPLLTNYLIHIINQLKSYNHTNIGPEKDSKINLIKLWCDSSIFFRFFLYLSYFLMYIKIIDSFLT